MEGTSLRRIEPVQQSLRRKLNQHKVWCVAISEKNSEINNKSSKKAFTHLNRIRSIPRHACESVKMFERGETRNKSTKCEGNIANMNQNFYEICQLFL